MARLALALLLYTGQRRADVVGFGVQRVRKDELQFTQRKGRNRKPIALTIPVLEVLQEVINSTKTGQLVFLVTQFGNPSPVMDLEIGFENGVTMLGFSIALRMV